MIVKIVKEDLENNKKSLVKKKLPNSKKASDFITQVDPDKFVSLILTDIRPKNMNRIMTLLFRMFFKFLTFIKEFFTYIFSPRWPHVFTQNFTIHRFSKSNEL